jgi:hypothetical protein
MEQELITNFDYIYSSDWGRMVYGILKDDSLKILLWEAKENYECCAKQMKETQQKIDTYAGYNEHFHLTYTELQQLFNETFSTLIEYNRKHYTTFE